MLNKPRGRLRFFLWVLKRAGVVGGQRLPWWGIVLNVLLFPSRILMWIGLSAYDPASDTLTIGKVRLPLYQLAHFFEASRRGIWYRVVGFTEYGSPSIEWHEWPECSAVSVAGGDEVKECLRAALRHIYYYDGPQKNVTAWDYWKRWCTAADYDPANAIDQVRLQPSGDCVHTKPGWDDDPVLGPLIREAYSDKPNAPNDRLAKGV